MPARKFPIWSASLISGRSGDVTRRPAWIASQPSEMASSRRPEYPRTSRSGESVTLACSMESATSFQSHGDYLSDWKVIINR